MLCTMTRSCSVEPVAWFTNDHLKQWNECVVLSAVTDMGHAEADCCFGPFLDKSTQHHEQQITSESVTCGMTLVRVMDTDSHGENKKKEDRRGNKSGFKAAEQRKLFRSSWCCNLDLAQKTQPVLQSEWQNKMGTGTRRLRSFYYLM